MHHGIEGDRGTDHAGARRARCRWQPILCSTPLAGRRRQPLPSARNHADRARLEVFQVHLGVRPILDRFGDAEADILAHRSASDFPDEDPFAHAGTEKTRGVAHLDPAHRLSTDAIGRDMYLVFEAVPPDELEMTDSALDIDVPVHLLHRGDALQRVELRTIAQQVIHGPQAPPDFQRQFGVPAAGRITEARQQSPGGIDADALDQLLAQRPHRLRVHQHHAPIFQPDQALGRIEVQLLEHFRCE
ncbi:hypothetical protein D9M68_579560 [compost metagenome]